MRQLKISVWIMAIIAVFLIIGSLISSLGFWNDYYRSLIFLVMVVMFTTVLIWCLFSFKISIKKIGFYLCHIGMVIIVICSFVSWGFMKDDHSRRENTRARTGIEYGVRGFIFIKGNEPRHKTRGLLLRKEAAKTHVVALRAGADELSRISDSEIEHGNVLSGEFLPKIILSSL